MRVLNTTETTEYIPLYHLSSSVLQKKPHNVDGFKEKEFQVGGTCQHQRSTTSKEFFFCIDEIKTSGGVYNRGRLFVSINTSK